MMQIKIKIAVMRQGPPTTTRSHNQFSLAIFTVIIDAVYRNLAIDAVVESTEL